MVRAAVALLVYSDGHPWFGLPLMPIAQSASGTSLYTNKTCSCLGKANFTALRGLPYIVASAVT